MLKYREQHRISVPDQVSSPKHRVTQVTSSSQVAEVTQVDRASAHLFAKILCKPLAGVTNHTQVMIVGAKRDAPPRPVEEVEPKTTRTKKGRKGA